MQEFDSIARLFELQSKLDKNLADEPETDSFLYSLFNTSMIIGAIKNIENGSSICMGSGLEKYAYRFLNYVILRSEEKEDEFISPRAKKEFTKKLKEIGIPTPQVVYTCYRDSIIKDNKPNMIYEVQQSAIGAPIGFNRPSQLVSYLNSLEDKVVLENNHSSDLEDLVDKYNLEMLKSRVLFGLPHNEKFLKVYSKLSKFKALDFHGGNILFDPGLGYSFIDLNMNNFILRGALSNFEKYLIESENENVDFDRLLKYSDGTLRHDYKDLYKNKEGHFEHFIFSGIYIKQLLNIMQTSTDPDLIESNEFAKNFKYKNMEQKYNGASPNTLDLLYYGISQNNEKALKTICSTYRLPKSFNFQTMFDCEKFIQAMDLTYAMAQPKNTTNLFENNISEM